MAIRVAISDPALLSGLTATLARNSCGVRAVSDRVFELTAHADGDVETQVELEFFLRAWQNANPGVDVLVG